MNALSPAGAAVSIHSADQLLDDLADHRRLSGTELAELREATGLTPEQIEAIRQGKPVDIPPNKYAYLREVMAGLDSKSPAEIDRIADYLDPGSRDSVKTALANGMQLMGNPLITDKRGNHGGMTELPAKVRESLQRNPVTFDIDNPAAGIYWRLNNYHDLVALTDLLGKGNADLRVNTDVDRGLLKQASELASATSNRQGLFLETDDETGHLVSDKDLNATINSMIALTDADHPAITDFLTAQHMDCTVEPGGHFDAGSHFVDLVTHPFDPGQHAVEDMFNWIGPNAGTPGHEGDLAALAANGYAHRLAENATLLGLDTNGSGVGHPTLGSINPELTQSLTKNIIPYLGALNGVEGMGIHTFPGYGFGNITEMQGMIQALDSDPVSAAVINHAGAAWENYMTSMYAAHDGDPTFAAAAGRFHEMFHEADTAELQGLFNQQNWDRIQQYNLDSTEWDTAKTVLTTGLKFLPGPWGEVGSLAGSVIDFANPGAKLSALGIVNDPSTIPHDHVSDAIQEAIKGYDNDTQGLYYQRDLALGYASTHGGLEADPRWAPFVSHADPDDPSSPMVLDWGKIQDRHWEFKKVVDALPVPRDPWNYPGDGYTSGARPGANIDPHQLPAPGYDASRPPQ